MRSDCVGVRIVIYFYVFHLTLWQTVQVCTEAFIVSFVWKSGCCIFLLNLRHVNRIIMYAYFLLLLGEYENVATCNLEHWSKKRLMVRRVDYVHNVFWVADLLVRYYSWTNNKAHQQLLLRLKQNCNTTMAAASVEDEETNDDIVNIEEEFQWTFYNSFFFALTTLSTIGQFTYVVATYTYTYSIHL